MIILNVYSTLRTGMDEFHFIVNPIAGSGRTAANFAAVEEKLRELQIPYTVSYTQHAHHGAELAKQALEQGAKCVVAAGGDGTINEVASALCNTDAVMGVLPFGTGNDFARTLKLPTEPMEALSVLLSGQVRSMDEGMANGLCFANVAGIGFDADVLRATEKYKVKYNGMLPYLLGIFDTMTHLRTIHAHICADGQTFDEDILLVIIGNGQYFGGGIRAVPSADPFDGYFDVRIVKSVGLLRFLTLLPRFVKGTLSADCPYTQNLRVRNLSVSCPESCSLELDGEIVSGTPAEFCALPGAIRLLVRAESNEKDA